MLTYTLRRKLDQVTSCSPLPARIFWWSDLYWDTQAWMKRAVSHYKADYRWSKYRKIFNFKMYSFLLDICWKKKILSKCLWTLWFSQLSSMRAREKWWSCSGWHGKTRCFMLAFRKQTNQKNNKTYSLTTKFLSDIIENKHGRNFSEHFVQVNFPGRLKKYVSLQIDWCQHVITNNKKVSRAFVILQDRTPNLLSVFHHCYMRICSFTGCFLYTHFQHLSRGIIPLLSENREPLPPKFKVLGYFLAPSL